LIWDLFVVFELLIWWGLGLDLEKLKWSFGFLDVLTPFTMKLMRNKLIFTMITDIFLFRNILK
jgi:hypothetical protein